MSGAAEWKPIIVAGTGVLLLTSVFLVFAVLWRRRQTE
jgi:hypothetical protein